MTGFDPDWRVHPGETIREAMRERQMSLARLRDLSTIAEVDLVAILNGRAPVTQPVADALERALGIRAAFWMRLQAIYDEPLPKERMRLFLRLPDDDD